MTPLTMAELPNYIALDATSLADTYTELGRPPIVADTSAEYAARAVTIDPDDLASEYARTPADLAYWGMVSAEAEAAYQAAKDRLRLVESTALLSAHMAADQATKRPPAARVEAMAEQAQPVQLAREELVRADSVRRRMRAVCDGIGAKLQALISLGAQLRRELDSGKYTT